MFYLLFICELYERIVVACADFLGGWRSRAKNETVLKHLYLVLLMSLYLIPMFSVTVIKSFLFLAITEEMPLRIDCLFIVDNSAWVLCNILTLALPSQTFDLLRLRDFFRQVHIFLTSQSRSEMSARSRRLAKSDFCVGEETAFTLINFTMTVMLAAASPLTLLTGLVFLIIKHIVDTISFIKGQAPTNISTNGYLRLGFNVMLFSGVLLQLYTAMVLKLRDENPGEGGVAFMISTVMPVLAVLSLLGFVILAQADYVWPLGFLSDVENFCVMSSRGTAKPQLRNFIYAPKLVQSYLENHV